MQNLFYYRLWQLILLLVIITVLMASFYFEYILGLNPCPLCVMQRLCVFLVFIFSMMIWLAASSKIGLYAIVGQLVSSGAGLFFASRQLWLQSLPADQVPACLPGFDVMLRYFPWSDILTALFWGAGDCAEVTWHWLGLSMPTWTALFFIAIFIASLINFYLWARIRRLMRA